MTTAAKSSFLLALAACHRTSSPDRLAAELEEIRVNEKLPALAIGVWKHGEQVALTATGFRKANDTGHPATVNDRWHLGSDTKAMTATLAGIYVDRQKLRWDETIGEIFAGETIAPALAPVTIDQLLQHRAGLPHDPSLDVLLAVQQLGDAPEARAQYVRAVLATPPKDIGKYNYSNEGYVLLGAAVERVSGKRWEDVMRDELFAPLGMTECGFGAPGTATEVDQPWGHTTKPVPPGPGADNAPAMAPAGGVNCSLPSWGKFLVVQAAGKTSLLTPATFAHLHDPPKIDRDTYTGGWLIRPMFGEPAYGHEGSNKKWHAIAIVAPAHDTAIAIVSNRADDHLAETARPLIESFLK